MAKFSFNATPSWHDFSIFENLRYFLAILSNFLVQMIKLDKTKKKGNERNLDREQPALGKKSGRGDDQAEDDDDGRENEREKFLAPLLVGSGIVDEQGEECVVGDGRQQGGVQERVEVGRELPQAASPVVLRPAGHRIVPVDL